MKEIYIYNGKRKFIICNLFLIPSLILFGCFAVMEFQEACSESLFTGIAIALVPISVFGIIIILWTSFFRYPYLFKADEKGLSTYILTKHELLIPWNEIEMFGVSSSTDTVYSPHHERGVKAVHGVGKKGRKSGLWFSVSERYFQTIYQDRAARLLKQTLEQQLLFKTGPYFLYNPDNGMVTIACSLPLVLIDLNPVYEQMESLRKHDIDHGEYIS